MRSLAIVVTVALAACGAQQSVSSDLPVVGRARLHHFSIDPCYSYVVDPAVEACFLRYNCVGAAMEAVDCGKLAARVPESAEVITWTADLTPAAPSTPASPAVPVPAQP
jgi:hypothetical protein